MTVRRRKIEMLCGELLKRNKVTSAPVPVKKIARREGAKLSFQRFDDESISGFIFKEPGNTVIGVNESHHPNRQRFTVAHEIGHLLLDHPSCLDVVHVDHILINFRDQASSDGTKFEEKEANYFAACLLIPRNFIEVDVKEIMEERKDLMDERVVAELARKYRVSPQALVYRLAYLKFIDEA